MNLKRFSTAALALAMTASLAPATLAAENLLISANPNAERKLVVNGTEVDLSAIPAAGSDLIPMRLLCETDGGSASWFEEENQGFFYLDDQRIFVNFSDLSVEMENGVLDGVKATLIEGVTFLPAATVNTLNHVTAEVDGGVLTVTTSNGLPLTKLAKSIIETVEMGCSNKDPQESLKEFTGIDPEWFEEMISYSPFMIQADHVLIGKYAEGVDKAVVKEALEELRLSVEKSFEFYLPEPYERAKEGKIVDSKDGKYVFFVISGDNAKAIELFQAGVAELEAQA